MKNWIVGDVKSSLIITVELHRLRMRHTKVLKKQLKTKKFTNGGATVMGQLAQLESEKPKIYKTCVCVFVCVRERQERDSTLHWFG